MRKRAVRLTLLAGLLASGVAAGVAAWHTQQDLNALSSSEHAAADHLDRLTALMAALTSAQQAYSASRQPDAQWFRHLADLIERIYAESAPLPSQIHRVASARPLKVFTDASGMIVQATARARDNLGVGRDLMAADLLLQETRESVETMSTSLRDLRNAETNAYAQERAALEQRSWLTIGAVSVVWAIALIAFACLPPNRHVEHSTQEAVLGLTPPPVVSASPGPPGIDLQAAADLCTAISRVTTADAFPDLLARAATLMDASGVILWTRSGDALCAMSSHGYEPELIARVSPIPLTSQTLTTAAWHEGGVRYVSGDAGAPGAIAAPMWGPAGCIGVLAAEVRHGRERETTARAFMELVAAQLAMTITPSAEANPPEETETLSERPLKAAGA